MGHLFISYHADDAEFAIGLMHQLDDAGFSVWEDNEHLRDGVDWHEAIDQAIREASALIVILTPAAKASEQVIYEWTFALGVGVAVIPVLREQTALHPRLETLPVLDFSADAQPWGKLVRQVQESTGGHRSLPDGHRSLPAGGHVGAHQGRPSSLLEQAQPGAMPRFLERIRSREHAHGDDLGALDMTRPDAVDKLIELLDSQNRDTRISAVRRLADCGEKAAIPALIRLLRDADTRVRDAAVYALGRLKAAAAVPGLLEVLRSGRPGPFGNALNNPVIAEALREIGTPAVPVLLDALSDQDWRVRLQVIETLGSIRAAEAAPMLTGMLHDAEWRVRWRAAEALGKLNATGAAVRDLSLALSDNNDDVRIAAAWALRQIKDPGAIPALIRALHDCEWRVRWTAAEALWTIGPAAVPLLLDTLHDRDDYVRRAAGRALAQIGETSVPGLVALLADDNWDVRGAAAAALHEIGEAAVPALVSRLVDGNWQAGWAAAEALRQIGSPDALEAVTMWEDNTLDGDDPAEA
ncbi:MAG: HEAT repeat domain-containing protein [Anaerolineae bacterium]|nr:HEAT repeat domain-containing protein [Anaerolineae bacterium]